MGVGRRRGGGVTGAQSSIWLEVYLTKDPYIGGEGDILVGEVRNREDTKITGRS